MNIHEYQAKEILKSFAVTVPKGCLGPPRGAPGKPGPAARRPCAARNERAGRSRDAGRVRTSGPPDGAPGDRRQSLS